MKKLTKLFLAFTLLFGSTIALKETKVEATEIQPYAQVINRSFDEKLTEFRVSFDGGPSEYVGGVVDGSYTHNISGSNEYITNNNLRVTLLVDYSYTKNGNQIIGGTYDLDISNITYKASGKKLIISYKLGIETSDNYTVVSKSITL